MRYRVVALAALAVFLSPTGAAAFCRTTTCSPTKASCALDDHGCVTGGAALHWKAARMPLVFRFQRQHSTLLVPEETVAAVRAAFYRWSDVVCPDGARTGLRFVEGEELVADKPLDAKAPRPEPFGIYFRDRGWPHTKGDDTSALTTVDFAPDAGAILYADIEVNTTDWLYATRDAGEGIDLQTVVSHEVGHFLGLSHSREPNSIMAAGLCDSGDRCARDRVSSRRLGADDLAAVCALYPATPIVEPPPAAASCAVEARGAAGQGASLRAGLASLAAFAVLALVRRRRR